eukprot:364128-Prorocentrum_minimum.AAC.3
MGRVEVDAREAVSGDTALHAAAKAGQLEAVQLLVTWRANPSLQNNDGFTAANLALMKREFLATSTHGLKQDAQAPALMVKPDRKLL